MFTLVKNRKGIKGVLGQQDGSAKVRRVLDDR